jgi:hypothetical protein
MRPDLARALAVGDELHVIRENPRPQVRNAAYRCDSPVTVIHHHSVPGVAGDDAARQVNVRSPS